MQENSVVIGDMGVLAELAYNQYDPNDSNNNTVRDASLTKTYTVIATQAIPEIGISDFGFQGVLLKDNSDNYVFAFRGTEADPIFSVECYKDLIIADIAYMGSGTAPQQMKDAMLFVQTQIALRGLNASNTAFTGHSLGGSIAGMASYIFGFEAYTFNGFGIKNMLWDANDTSVRIDPREISYDVDPITLEASEVNNETLGKYLETLGVTNVCREINE